MKHQHFGLAVAAGVLILSVAGASHAAGDPARGGDATRGQAKSEVCVACHGVEGNNATAEFPRLAGQHASYPAHSLEAYTTGERMNPIMQGFAATLSRQDRADLAAWYASQKGLSTPPLR